MDKIIMTGNVLCTNSVDNIRKGAKLGFTIKKSGNHKRLFLVGDTQVKHNIFSACFAVIDVDPAVSAETIVKNKIIRVLSEQENTIGAVEQIMSIFKEYADGVKAGKAFGRR